MKILFCVNRDIYANIALNRIFPALAPDDEAQVFFSESVAGNRATGAALTYLRFYEQDLLNEHVFPQQEARSADGTGVFKTFQQLSHFYGFPMQVIQNINHPETVSAIEKFAPDLIVSIRFGHIFKQQVLSLPKQGVINLHSGLLPEYRGILATFWSLLHERLEYGYTLHAITDASIDTGPILDRRSFAVKAGSSLFEHTVALYLPAAESILKAIDHYRSGQTPPHQPQNETESGYYTLPQPEDFEQLITKGFPILNREAYYHCLQQYESQPHSVFEILPA
ncbi:formyl transferase [Vampirovibrio sp.]|uniref:formyl transferase n=1 Tax=Vampirovibrio sp. TaxID=2717857 RepID=UPI003594412E